MASEESNAAEFQERTGLKRKLTGPPRLLLGKPRCPGQDERKSRRHRRHNDGAPVDMTAVEQSAELPQMMSPESCDSGLTTELDEGTCVDLQEDCLETMPNLEQSMKKQQRRSNAGATIRWILSCVRRRTESGMKAVEDAKESKEARVRSRDNELLPQSSEQKPCEKIGARKFKMGMFRIFKKRPSKEKRGRHGAGQQHETVGELSAETSDGQCAEPPAVDEQQNESSGIEEDVTRIHEENHVESRNPKAEVMETISLNIDINVDLTSVFTHENHHHPSGVQASCRDEQEPKIHNSESPLAVAVKSNFVAEDLGTSLEDLVPEDIEVDVSVENTNVFKSGPPSR